jgi:hypothetical protein
MKPILIAAAGCLLAHAAAAAQLQLGQAGASYSLAAGASERWNVNLQAGRDYAIEGFNDSDQNPAVLELRDAGGHVLASAALEAPGAMMGTGFHTTYAGSYVLVARAVSFPGGIPDPTWDGRVAVDTDCVAAKRVLCTSLDGILWTGKVSDYTDGNG